MRSRLFKVFLFLFSIFLMVNVDASITCGIGKPGDTVNCEVSNLDVAGLAKNIVVDAGISFDSCDVCDNDGNYAIQPDKTANFKFKIDSNINENKTLNVTIAGETAAIKVVVASEDEEEENSEEVTYTVTLIPGNGRANVTKNCTVNSLNSTCNVTLDEIEDNTFIGWDTDKSCNGASRGNIKVNKDITYYACYKNQDTNNENSENTSNENTELLLKSLIIMNGDEEIDLGFSIRIKEYNITIPTSVENLVVNAVAQNENVKVSVVGNDSLKEKENVITITLTDEEGSTNKYVINVNISDEVSLPLLKNLIIGAYSINFDPETFVYTVTIDKGIKELSIDAIPENDEFDVQILGNNDLKDGSQITIKLHDLEKDISSAYTINIVHERSDLVVYIGIGVGLLIILIILLIFVVKKGNKTSNKSGNSRSNTNNKQASKSINNKSNVSEVAPTIPVVPSAPQSTNSNVIANNVVKENKEELEVLDF